MKKLVFGLSGQLQKIQPELSNLEKSLTEIQGTSNKVEAIVKLFQIISPIQDAGGFSALISKLQKKNRKKFATKLQALEILQKHFENAGRCESGFNRTKTGEEVTSSKVYLGDVYGIWTKPASYWLNHQQELEQDFREDLSKDPEKPVSTWYCINGQAGTFVRSHAEGILKQISVLKIAS